MSILVDSKLVLNRFLHDLLYVDKIFSVEVEDYPDKCLVFVYFDLEDSYPEKQVRDVLIIRDRYCKILGFNNISIIPQFK
jgi:hypothetical protein